MAVRVGVGKWTDIVMALMMIGGLAIVVYAVWRISKGLKMPELGLPQIPALGGLPEYLPKGYVPTTVVEQASVWLGYVPEEAISYQQQKAREQMSKYDRMERDLDRIETQHAVAEYQLRGIESELARMGERWGFETPDTWKSGYH